MNYYSQLEKHFKKLSHLDHLAAICGWDQASMMPEGGNDARAEAMAELAMISHSTATAPHLSDWFAQAALQTLDPQQRRSLEEMKRQWQAQTLLPPELVEQQSLAGSTCEHAWRTQRKQNDWAGFAENLKPVVKLARQEAQIRANATGTTPYNALLDLYEPGMTSDKVDELFSDLKCWLPALIKQVQAKQQSDVVLKPVGPFSTEQQKQLSLEVMDLLCFDKRHGRLDISAHPFCGGVPSDVRITTRYDEADFTSALMGVIHETGHARYEQGLPKAWAGLPAGQARSMGIHESQSLFFEMQLSRSPMFIETLAPMAANIFARGNDSALSASNLLALNTRVQPGFIRVDADELTYPVHVILRYEIEKALISGEIEVQDIPRLWNEKSTQYLGLSTDGNFENGCMQDIHWTDGSFGYFPSYTLGAMYAAQFMAAMKKTVDVDGAIKAGDLSPIFNWLEANVWSKASLLSTDELVRQATGETLNPAHFRKHLEDRYLK